MKKTILTALFVCALAMMFSYAQDDRIDLSELKYGRVSAYSFVQADVHQKSDDQKVIWFQLFDRLDDKDTAGSYSQSHVKRLDKYPAKIAENMHIWILIGNRFEIRLMGDSKAPEYRNTARLRNFIMKFDLKGMEKYDGPLLKGQEMVKFLPVLKDGN